MERWVLGSRCVREREVNGVDTSCGSKARSSSWFGWDEEEGVAV
jgi:hypothetical protein